MPKESQKAPISALPILRSSIDINIAVLNPSAAFQQLNEHEQRQVYHIYRAVNEVHKLSFLHNSPESPIIFLFFQQLLYQSAPSTSDLLIELQKLCHANGLSEQIAKFFQYVALFYYHGGNYDVQTGTKFYPELDPSSFTKIISLAQNLILTDDDHKSSSSSSSSHIHKLLDACVHGVYSPQPNVSSSWSIPNDTDQQQANGRLLHPLAHSIYDALSLNEIWSIDRLLATAGIAWRNTRFVRMAHANGQTVTFNVLQTRLDDGSSSLTFRLVDSDHEIQVERDHASNFFLKNAIVCLRDAQTPEAGMEADSAHWLEQLQQRLFGHRFNTHMVSASAVQSCMGLFPVSAFRDPLHRRGGAEAFVGIRNPAYYARVQSILDTTLPKLLALLPFHEHFERVDQMRHSFSFDCIDLVAATRSATNTAPDCCLPLTASASSPDRSIQAPVILLTNCMDHYWRNGLPTYEKMEIMDGLFDAQDATLVSKYYCRLLLLRFLCEELVAPATKIELQQHEDNKTLDFDHVVYVPAELLEQELDHDDDDDQAAIQKALRRKLLRHAMHSSFTKRATIWYGPSETAATKFSVAIGFALEACRRILSGLLLISHPTTIGELLHDWTEDDAGKAKDDLDGVSDQEKEEDAVLSTEDDTGDPNVQIAMAYWLMMLRETMWGLLQYSPVQLAWDPSSSMLAKFMVVHMLQTELTTMKPLQQPFFQLDLQQHNVAKEKAATTSFKVRLHVDTAEQRQWLRQARLQSRRWLQHVQWMQMTGNVHDAEQWYRTFASMTQHFMGIREHLVQRLTAFERRRKKETTVASKKATVAATGGNSTQQTTSSTENDAGPLKLTKISHFLNASTYSHETLWITPHFRLVTIESFDEVDSSGSSSSAKPQPETKKKVAPPSEQSTQTVMTSTTRVEMHVYKPELRHAVEAAIVRFGPLTDQEVDAFLRYARISTDAYASSHAQDAWE